MKTWKSIAGASCLARYLGALLCIATLVASVDKVRAQTPFYEASAEDIAGAPGTLRARGSVARGILHSFPTYLREWLLYHPATGQRRYL